MKKIRGLFDMDGVLVDLLPAWRDIYNEKYDDNLTLEDMFSSWNVENNVKPEAGDDIYNMLDTAELYSALNPIEGAIEGLQEIHASGKFEIHLVTAFMGKGGVADGKCLWIAEHLPFIHRDNIILAHDKELVYGDFLVDDSEKNLLKWIDFQASLNPEASAVMMEAPHNKDYDMDDIKYSDIDIRVKDWQELLDYLFNIVS